MYPSLLKWLSALRTLAAPLWRHVLPIAVLLIAGAIFGGYHLLSRGAAAAFAELYGQYAAMAERVDNAAYVPGAQNNPVRQQLNAVLQEVLFERTSPERRLLLADIGLQLLEQSREQLDLLSGEKDVVDAQVAKMQVAVLNSPTMSDSAKSLVAYAKERSAIVSDIRAYSFKANFEMQQIFDRIREDSGKLTPAHIAQLNSEVPKVEREFDKRAALYRALEEVSARMEDTYAAIGE